MNNIVLDFRHSYNRGERLEAQEIVYQYDTGRILEAYVPETEQGFVLNIGFEKASVLSVISVDDVVADEEGGYKILATIPDSILTGYGDLLVYIVAGGGANVLATTYEGVVSVRYKQVAEGYIPPEEPATSIIERCEVAATAAVEAADEARDIADSVQGATAIATSSAETATAAAETATSAATRAETAATAAEAAMVDKLDNTFITGLDESASGDDTDLLVVGNRGTAVMRRFTLANLATYIKGKIASLIRDGTIGSVTVDLNAMTDGWYQIDVAAQPLNMPVAANSGILFQASNTAGDGSKYQLYVYRDGTQLWQRACWYGSWSSWQKIYGRSYASVTGSYGFSSVSFWRHGNEVIVQFTGTPSGMTVGWKTIAQIPAGFVPLSNTPYATLVPQDTGFQPFVVRATSAGTLDVNPTYVQLTGMVNAVYKYYVD